jgi:hypothetical protein
MIIIMMIRIWDVTIPGTVTDSYLAVTSIAAGAVAEAAAERETSKHAALVQLHQLAPPSH